SGKGSTIEEASRLLAKDFPILLFGWKSVRYRSADRLCDLTAISAKSVKRFPSLVNRLSVRVKTAWYRLAKASLCERLHPVFSFEDRDLLLDPLILSVSYLGLLDHFSIDRRVAFMQRVGFGSLCDAYVFLDVSPDIAYERVVARHRRERRKLSPHENLNDLRRLQNQYLQGIDYLESKGIPVIRVRGDEKNIRECGAQTAEALYKMVKTSA
ncbi:MAG: hypothetical protein ABFS19_10440, partial [Thermodesulfobacteriota bacterium]